VVIYLDTSAFVKLVRAEAQSGALREYLAERPAEPLVSSVLIAIETRRAVLREAASLLPRADLLLTRVGQVGLSHAVAESASRLPDPTLRSLDAIHLSTALLLRDEISAFVTYDKRLAATALDHRLPVALPGDEPA
jgi:predicted nucleic acid-binding protein